MLPRSLSQLSTRREGDRIVISYLNERDRAWLGALLEEYRRSEGELESELHMRLREPLSVPSPKAKLRLARHVLEGLVRAPVAARPPPREARWRAFSASAALDAPRAVILEAAAREIDVSARELEAGLFADLRSERRIGKVPAALTAAALAQATNLALVSSLVSLAAQLSIRARGGAHALVRQAKRAGLLCVIRPLGAPREDALELDVSGPFALFRHTRVYGRALAGLFPTLLACSEFELDAECVLGPGAGRARLVVGSNDGLGPPCSARTADDALRARFASVFRGLAPSWQIQCEPEPVRVGPTLFFPDFELTSALDRAQRWLVEIVRFWTARHLADKLARLDAAGLARVVLLVDTDGGAPSEALPGDARLVPYRRQPDARFLAELVVGRQPEVGASSSASTPK